MKESDVSYLFFLCGPVPNDSWTGTGPQTGGWGPVIYIHTFMLEVQKQDYNGALK